MKKKIRGIIFDMDGVLLDTEEAMLQATIRGFADYGAAVLPEDFTPFFGRGSEGYIGGVGAKYGIPYTPALRDHMYAKYLEIADREAVRYPGIPGEIRRLHAEGYRLAVASSAARIKVTANLKAAGIDETLLQCVITEDEITRNKPDPEIFLKAAEGLGLSPEECLVAEDSISGVRAAVRAGMQCVGVRGTYPDEDLLAAGAFQLVSHLPSEVKALSLEEALSADPQEVIRWRRLGIRVLVRAENSFAEAAAALCSADIDYDGILTLKDGNTYNRYGRKISALEKDPSPEEAPSPEEKFFPGKNSQGAE